MHVQALQSGSECQGRVFVGADAAPLTFQVHSVIYKCYVLHNALVIESFAMGYQSYLHMLSLHLPCIAWWLWPQAFCTACSINQS